MKKSLKIMAALLLALVCGAQFAQAENLTVNDGAATHYLVPVNSFYYNEAGTRSQVMYPADQLTAMAGLPINGVTFYFDNEGCKMDGGLLRVSIGETDLPSYASASAFVSGLTTVATVSMTRGENDLIIDFDTPYVYQGGSLVLDFYVEEPGEAGASYFLGQVTSTDVAISSGDLRQFLPKATFDYGVAPEYGAKVRRDVVNFNDTRTGDRDEQIVYLKNIGLNAFNPTVSASAPFSAALPAMTLAPGETVEIPVAFEPEQAGNYQGTLSIDCGAAGIVQVALNGTALASGVELTVCDGTATNQYVPFYGIYTDDVNTLGQMIYPAEMLTDAKGGKIVALTFYATRGMNLRNVAVELSLMNTDQNEFAQATPLTGLTTLAATAINQGDTVIAFELETPFDYTGANLAVQVKVKNAGWTSTTNFYGEATGYNASLSCYKSWSGDKNEPQQFLPKATFLYEPAQGPATLRGDVDGSGDVGITDVTVLIDLLLTGGNATQAADCDLDGSIGIGDVTVLIDYLLSGNWSM